MSRQFGADSGPRTSGAILEAITGVQAPNLNWEHFPEPYESAAPLDGLTRD